jgi:hypothetical protein
MRTLGDCYQRQTEDAPTIAVKTVVRNWFACFRKSFLSGRPAQSTTTSPEPTLSLMRRGGSSSHWAVSLGRTGAQLLLL